MAAILLSLVYWCPNLRCPLTFLWVHLKMSALEQTEQKNSTVADCRWLSSHCSPTVWSRRHRQCEVGMSITITALHCYWSTGTRHAYSEFRQGPDLSETYFCRLYRRWLFVIYEFANFSINNYENFWRVTTPRPQRELGHDFMKEDKRGG